MNRAFRVAGFCITAAAISLYAMNLSAAVTLPNNVFVYSQNFDGVLGTTSLTTTTSPFNPTIGSQAPIPGTSGWDGAKVAGNGTGQMPYTVDTGAANSGAIYSYGASAANTERALGMLASGTNTAGIGVELINNTGSIISSVDLQFFTEWWRGSTSQVDGATFRYQVGSSGSTNYLTSSASTAVPALDMVGPNTGGAVDLTTYPNSALDGNTKKSPLITGSLSNLNWTPGTSLYLSWRDSDNGGSDAGIGLDDFQLTATPLLGVKPYWDPNGAAAGLGGPGIWDTTSARWNDNSGTGTPGTFSSSVVAIFSGTAGAVTIDAGGVTTASGIQIESDGYTFSGGTLTLGSNSPITVLSPTATATISSKISGSSGLNKGGAGTLAITSNANDFTGDVTIGAGTLLISNDANLGNPSNGLVLNGGTLKLNVPGNLIVSAARAVSGTGGTFDIGSGNTLTLQGSVNMTGTLALAAQGNVIFSQSTPAVGGLSLPGTAAVTVGDGSPSNTLTINNAGGNTITVTNALTVNGSLNFSGTALTSTRFINVPAGATFTVTGNTSALARVGLSGAGTFDLKGNNSGINAGMQFGTTGSAGPLVKLYDGNSIGTIPINVVSNFLNSGTFEGQGSSPIVFSNAAELLSIGSNTAFPFTFTGANMEFAAPINLFRPSGTNAVKIAVNNNTTFSGGWNVGNATGNPGDTGTLTNTTGGLVVGGTGTMTLKGGSYANLVVPITADGATVIFDGVNPNNSGVANFGGTTGQTTNIQIGATNNGKFNLLQASAIAGTTAGNTIPRVPGKVVLSAGGRLGTGGLAQIFGTLSVTNNTSIDLGVGSAVVQFADSSTTAWASSPLLSINNWNGTVSTGGGLEQVLFGNSAAGLLPAQVSAIHFAGYNGALILSSGEVVPTSVSTKVLGDFNNDGTLTTADIPAMLQAMTDLTTFRTTNALPTTDDFLNVADVDLNGKVDHSDIQALLNKFSGAGSLAAVPEPATFVLVILAIPALAVARRVRRAA